LPVFSARLRAGRCFYAPHYLPQLQPPALTELRSQLAAQKAEIAAEIAAVKSASGTAAPGADDRGLVAQVEARVAAFAAELARDQEEFADLKRRLDQLQSGLDATPAAAAVGGTAPRDRGLEAKRR
jgi:hypothetical protein